MEENRDPFIKEEENEISLLDILSIVRHNWMWFIISIAICLSLAVLYLLYAPNVYTRTATVLIKDDAKGGSGVSEAAAFGDLDMFNLKRNVDNELLVFQSEMLMKEVVKQLNLDINYTVKEGLRTLDLYRYSPLLITFLEAGDTQEFTFKATPLSADEVMLSDLPESLPAITVVLKDTIDTPFGKAVITPTSFYEDEAYNVPITITKSSKVEVVQEYKKKLKVALGSKTATIINLTIEDRSIQRAEDLLNRLILAYNTAAIDDKNQVLVNTSEFIAERLNIITKELGGVDSNIEQFRRENRVTNLQSEVGMYLTESSRFSQEQLSLESQKQMAQYIREYLTDPARSSMMIPANTGMDVSIEGQINEYNATMLKRDRLIQNSSTRNPVVMDLNNSLNAMRQTITRAIDNLIVGLDVRTRNVKDSDRRNTGRMAAVPTQERQLLSIERQQKIKEELYLYLLNKREENALSQSMAANSARVIDDATGSDIPIAPKKSIILLAALIIGMVIPAGVFWGTEALNTAVRNRKDIEDALTIPFLGDIPLCSGNSKKKKKRSGDDTAIVVREGGRDSVSEAFRILRTNMDFMQIKDEKGHEGKVIQYTSFQPGSGKTFISLNLAMSFALARKKVILVDLDLRKRTLSSALKYEKDAIGMTNYLTGKVRDVNMLVSDNLKIYNENLNFISAGPVPPNPSELLLSTRLETLIETLRGEYDYIFLDNVPAGVVADATIINRVADITLYVVRAGLMDKRMLPQLESLYRNKKFKSMAVILNAVNFKRAGYGYYGYRYGYSYGYEYEAKS